VAQCVWWLASVCGLEQGLVDHIDNLKEWASVVIEQGQRSTSWFNDTIPNRSLSHKVPLERLVSVTARDLQEDLRQGCKENYIHPDRRNQVDSTSPDICDLDLYVIDQGPCSEVIASTEDFLGKFRKHRKAFNKQRKVDQLSRTRSGKILPKPLTQGQRKYLQCIPKSTMKDYLEDRK
jgi:hypothetical protein